MIPKPLELITVADIKALVTDEIPESSRLEYKESLQVATDGEKKEFAADVASFANASGGDIIYGIVEKRDSEGRKTGIPEIAKGLANISQDETKRKLEGILLAQIEPRISGIQIQPIEGFPSGPVLVLRVPQSWNPPHMVRGGSGGSYRFYSRGAAGKYLLDGTQIRLAFASETVIERLRRFRDERLARIVADETPIVLNQNPRVVLHVLPVQPLAAGESLDIRIALSHSSSLLWPMNFRSGGTRFNIDGFVSYGSPRNSRHDAYLQLFRNGAIESVEAAMIYPPVDEKLVPSELLEREVILAVERYCQFYSKVGIAPPFVVILSLLGVRGYKVATGRRDSWRRLDEPNEIDREVVVLPDIVIQDYPSDKHSVGRLLRPIFDTMWQASGWHECEHYGPDGNWTTRAGL